MGNNCFELIHNFTGEPFDRYIDVKFNKQTSVTCDDILRIISKIDVLIDFWNKDENKKYLDGRILAEIHFKTVLSKSKRIKQIIRFLNHKSNKKVELVGAKYVDYASSLKHVMIYCFESLDSLFYLKKFLEAMNGLLDNKFSRQIDVNNYQLLKVGDLEYFGRKDDLISLFLEVSRIESFEVPTTNLECDKDTILVKFYINPNKVLEDLNIPYLKTSIVNNSVVIKRDYFERIKEAVPYLIASGIHDKTNRPPFKLDTSLELELPDIGFPDEEPIVGVIDSGVIKNCYLYKDKWVDVVECRNSEYIDDNDVDSNFHGTIVDSLIVHGHEINDNKFINLNDNCGYFRVKHFCVMADYNNTVDLMETIEKIIINWHETIKVWNLSIGSNSEISNNFVSPLASKLDELQEKYDVIFIIAATNNKIGYKNINNYKIGSPADSLNGLVVSSVKVSTNQEATYARKGGVLHYFIKPDVGYYGGDDEQPIYAYNGFRICEVQGTSFAAPLVARKIAYLIYKVGLNKELSKALIIDSATKWNCENCNPFIGRGIVPISIFDVVRCDDDEIKFFINVRSLAYQTLDYSLPVPLDKDFKYPYIAKATACYFSKVSPNAGVDYTDIEVDCKLGPVGNSGTISSIKNDTQYMDGSFSNELDVRKELFKWDTVKFLMTKPNKTGKYKSKVLEDKNNKWGINLTTIYRNDTVKPSDKYNFNVGIVVTLKSVDKVNRSLDFFKMVQKAPGWAINVIDLDVINEYFIKINEKIKWDD